MSMNNNKYKATTVLTGEDFPPLSRLSTEKFNPKALSITPPHEITLFSEIVCQTQDHQHYKNPPASNYIELHEIKAKSRKLTSHQDMSKNIAATQYYQEKENTNQEITNSIQHHIQKLTITYTISTTI